MSLSKDFRSWLLCICLMTSAACSHAPLRAPQATTPSYNAERVRLLKLAADHGVFILIPDATLRDIPMSSIGERCRKTNEGPWIEKIYSTLSFFERDPRLLDRVHVIEFRRGDSAQVEVSKDLDGAVNLIVMYSKSEMRKKVETLSEIPCAEASMELIGGTLSTISFEWPGAAALSSALTKLDDRPQVPRFEVDRRFLSWLADRMTVFRLTPELAFEKTPSGQPLLVGTLAKLSEETSGGVPHPAVDFWLKEINSRSRIGSGIKFFGLKHDPQLSTGIAVDSVGKFARKMNGYSDPTYPVISYKLENGSFAVNSLGDLNSCLEAFMSTYRSPVSSMSAYELDNESFLFPGHFCATSETGDAR